MKRSTLALAAIALVVGASSAHAQAAAIASPVHFGLSAGATIPNGDLSDVQKAGYHIQGTAEMTPVAMPLGFRLDLMYNGLTGKDAPLVGKLPNLSLLSANANAVYNFPGASSVRPYVLGGVGLYNYKVVTDNGVTTSSSRETKFGLNGGIGLRFQLSGFQTFAEARFHNAFVDNSNLRFIPISFGIMF